MYIYEYVHIHVHTCTCSMCIHKQAKVKHTCIYIYKQTYIVDIHSSTRLHIFTEMHEHMYIRMYM